MKRRHWPFVLGATLIGVAAGMIAKKKAPEENHNWAKKYVGHWQFENPKQKTTHDLKIKEDFRLFIDGEVVKGTLEELSPQQLVWQDEFGYHLKVVAENAHPKEIYDEADDLSYALIAKNKV